MCNQYCADIEQDIPLFDCPQYCTRIASNQKWAVSLKVENLQKLDIASQHFASCQLQCDLEIWNM